MKNTIRAWSFEIRVSKNDQVQFEVIHPIENYSLLVPRHLQWGNYQMYLHKIKEAFSLLGYKSVFIFGVKTKISRENEKFLTSYEDIIVHFADLVKSRTK